MIRIALVLAIGCSAPAWHPAAHTDEIALAGTVVARGEADATVSVTTLVTLDDHTAPGTVRLRGVPVASALTSPHVRLARARAWQALSEMLAATPDRAYEAARLGNAELEGYAFGDDGYHLRARVAHDAHSERDALRLIRIALGANIDWYVRQYHAVLW